MKKLLAILSVVLFANHYGENNLLIIVQKKS